MTNFKVATERILRARINSDALVKIFSTLKKTADENETEQASLTLGFSDDNDIKTGDYIPTIMLSIVKVSDKHAADIVAHVEARSKAAAELGDKNEKKEKA